MRDDEGFEIPGAPPAEATVKANRRGKSAPKAQQYELDSDDAAPEPPPASQLAPTPKVEKFNPRADHHAPDTTAADVMRTFTRDRKIMHERVLKDLARKNPHVAALLKERDELRKKLDSK